MKEAAAKILGLICAADGGVLEPQRTSTPLRAGSGTQSKSKYRILQGRSSAHQREYPYRAAGAVFQFCWGDHDHSACHGSTIQVGDVFELVDTVRQRVLAHGEIFRGTVVDAQGVNAKTQRVASLNQEPCCILGISGKV